MFDERFTHQSHYEPPSEFPLALPCSGIGHHLSGPGWSIQMVLVGSRYKVMKTLGLANTFLAVAGSFLFGKPALVEYLGERSAKNT